MKKTEHTDISYWARQMELLTWPESAQEQGGFALADAQQAFARVREALAADCASALSQMDFIFEDPLDVEDSTRRNVMLFSGWHSGGLMPSVASLCIAAVQKLVRDIRDPLMQVLLSAAILAEIPHRHAYHNNMHFREVLVQAIRLIAVHNSIFEGTERALEDSQILKLLIAGCVHDLGHDGKGNTHKGVFEQGRLERRSFALAAPYLKAAGLTDLPTLEEIKVMILCTDVTPLDDPGNPASQMKAAFRYHYLDRQAGLSSLNLDPDLKPLQRDRDLSLMALLLHEADIATSAGLTYELTKFETACLRTEMEAEDARPQHVVEFLSQICKRRMLSDAGQKLYAANMARIYALAEEDVARGDRAFPPPDEAAFLRMNFSAGLDGHSQTLN